MRTTSCALLKIRFIVSFFLSTILAQSVYSNPDTLNLPFYEDFASGGFDQNNWTAASDNWQVTWQHGKPYPCARFNWNPVIYQGGSTLTGPLLSAEDFDFGNIMLEFDLKLTDRFETGTERLYVEVLGLSDWVVVHELKNNGSFDWQALKINITEYSMGKVFRIRFRTEGENSGNIVGWFIDNIHIYRSCDPPEEVTLQEVIQGMFMRFNTPSSLLPVAEWMFYGSDFNFSGIGLTSGSSFRVAARWKPEMLEYYQHTSITRFRFFLQDDGFTSIIVKIWKLDGSDTLLVNHLMPNPLSGQWNELVLETPIAVDLHHELWAGYEIIGQPAGKFPAGTDSGPAVTGYGDLISLDGGVTWDALSEIAPSLSYNWSIQLFMDDFGYVQPPSAFRYNIYRSLDQDPYEYFSTVEHVPNQYEYTFLDDLEGIPWTTLFCYKVTCVWDNGEDYCESDPGHSKWSPNDDMVCIYYPIGVQENKMDLKISPNPAREAINISMNEGIEEVEVLNTLGITIMRQDFGGLKNVSLSVLGLSPGLYHLRINTGVKVYFARIIVTN
jgi:hypothetical protein